MTDTELATLCGMSPQNLRTTYKKNPDPIKQRVYQFLQMGAQAWLEKEKVKNKNKELLVFIQNMESIEIEQIERKGRSIESFD